MNKFIKELKKELKEQHKTFTDEPVYLVEEKVRVMGLKPDYSDTFMWYDNDNRCQVTDKTLIKELERVEQNDIYLRALAHYEKVYYYDRWEYISLFLTRKAAQEFLDMNKGLYDELRIYEDSAYRYPEVLKLLNYISEL